MITSVNEEAIHFTIADGTYYYDTNDTFQVSDTTDGDCIPVSMSNFETELSIGDEVGDTTLYSQDEEASSVICIEGR